MKPLLSNNLHILFTLYFAMKHRLHVAEVFKLRYLERGTIVMSAGHLYNWTQN